MKLGMGITLTSCLLTPNSLMVVGFKFQLLPYTEGVLNL